MIPVEAVVAGDRRPGVRRRLTVLLLGILVAAWLVVALRMYFFPPPGGVAPSIFALLALAAFLNAFILGFCAWWLWRGARWATWAAGGVLLIDALLIIQPSMETVEWVTLLVTLGAGVLVLSLLVRPEAMILER